jgi:hypothetical protein
MSKFITKTKLTAVAALLAAGFGLSAQAQSTDTVFKPHGSLWGYAFGDLAYKGNSDNIGTSTVPVYRGGANQYTGAPINANLFQFRRIYLGYNYDISPKFSAEFLLAAEDDFNGGLDNQPAGDVLVNGKFSPYIKLANIRWKNIFKNSDLVIGQQATPTFAKTGRNSQTAEEVWAYRSIERTITDIRRTPSYDMGASLQGWFDKTGSFGYTFLVGNGTSAKPETDNYKWFYGDVYAKFFKKRLIIDLYQDYEKLNWGVYAQGATGSIESPNGHTYRDRNMTKLFVAWTDKKFTVGAEVFQNTLLGDVKVSGVDKNTYYRTTKSTGVSVFARGRIISAKNGDPLLGFFARFDNYDPTGNLSSIVNDANTKSYTASTGNYEPTTKERFVTYGLDFTPFKNVHFMPNVWMNTYESGITDGAGDVNINGAGTAYHGMNGNINNAKGTDLVYRLTFYYIYR